ncbi:beta-lactamase family protein [Baekduia soli]|uniref:Beta-lactamase family protein n=1 Tax=Baekduia soli TaxID=496014 RepID=A0A5B8UC27_9ACTN|nr:serine hydrolase domain-containing protein [Baekduia soli]QEC50388.1 beta-lactamase family protein [Baekduia soli]
MPADHTAAATAHGFDPDRLSRIERGLQPYVDEGRIPGFQFVLARDGDIVHEAVSGHRVLETRAPVTPDTIWRIYSMTKPITSVAAMMLWEEGAFELDDPVSRFIPSFGDLQVYARGSSKNALTVAATEPIRIRHLLTHTSGLTYGFHHTHPVDAMYREAGFEWGTPRGLDLAACCDAWAALPLLFQPGAEWNYSVATDVLGRVVEVASGETLDAFFARRILGPLGMADTGFGAPEADHGRLAALYVPDPQTGRATRSEMGDAALRRPRCLSGGGGLVSTAADYHRFAQLLLGDGAFDGVRLLGSRTARYLRTNHLPGGADLQAVGRPLFAETTFAGVGFGLGVQVLLDPVAFLVPSSPGEFGWGGAASTVFWVDPVDRITMVFLTQLLPSSTYPLRSRLRQLVQQALVD